MFEPRQQGDNEIFNRQWSARIEADKKILLPMYRERVKFPKAPFLPETITAYVSQVRPYLLVSQVVRKWGLLLSLAFFLLGFAIAFIWL